MPTTPTPTAIRQDARRETRDAWREAASLDVLTPDRFLQRCERAVLLAFPAMAPADREDLASELRINVARKYGWTPRRVDVALTFLQKRAATLQRDLSAVGAADPHAVPIDPTGATPDGVTPGPLAVLLTGDRLPDPDPDAASVAAAIGATGAAADAVETALSGYGGAGDLAAARGWTPSYAHKRLSQGRAKLRETYPTPADLLDAMEATGALDAPLLAGEYPDRLALTPEQRAARRAVDTLADTTPAAHAPATAREPRCPAPAKTGTDAAWEGVSCPINRPAIRRNPARPGARPALNGQPVSGSHGDAAWQ